MAKKNEATPFVRQCMALWVASNRNLRFSIADIIAGLQKAHIGLAGIDLSKAVSNELTRLEYVGILSSEQGTFEDGCGVGRPPRVYVKRVCWLSLEKIKRLSR
mgnify:CR=1 FL=1